MAIERQVTQAVVPLDLKSDVILWPLDEGYWLCRQTLGLQTPDGKSPVAWHERVMPERTVHEVLDDTRRRRLVLGEPLPPEGSDRPKAYWAPGDAKELLRTEGYSAFLGRLRPLEEAAQVMDGGTGLRAQDFVRVDLRTGMVFDHTGYLLSQALPFDHLHGDFTDTRFSDLDEVARRLAARSDVRWVANPLHADASPG